MKRVITAMTVVCMLFCLAACSTAAEDSEETESVAGETYSGTVDEITSDTLTLTTEEGTSITVSLTDSTIFSYSMEDKLDGMDSDEAGEVTELPEGELPEMNESGEALEKPDGDLGSEMTPTWETVRAGDTVTVVVDADGNAESVTIASSMESGMNGGPEGIGDGAASEAPADGPGPESESLEPPSGEAVPEDPADGAAPENDGGPNEERGGPGEQGGGPGENETAMEPPSNEMEPSNDEGNAAEE